MDQLFPKRQILDSSKLKEFADDYFKFYENCRKFSKHIKNTAGKGEIARYEQFLLFPYIANFHGHALSILSLIKKSMRKSMSTVKAREFPEFGEHQLCVIANR